MQLVAKLHEAQLTLRNKPDGGAETILTLSTFIESTENLVI